MRNQSMQTLLMLGALAALVLLPSKAQAYYEGPWCAVINIGAGVIHENCSMPNYQTCRSEALRFGSSSFCRQNAGFSGYWRAPSQPRRAKHKRRHHRR